MCKHEVKRQFKSMAHSRQRMSQFERECPINIVKKSEEYDQGNVSF